MPPAGLSSPSGVFVDGLGKGVPGSDYVRTFGPKILAERFPQFNFRTRLEHMRGALAKYLALKHTRR
jgi:hypothetical protein